MEGVAKWRTSRLTVLREPRLRALPNSAAHALAGKQHWRCSDAPKRHARSQAHRNAALMRRCNSATLLEVANNVSVSPGLSPRIDHPYGGAPAPREPRLLALSNSPAHALAAITADAPRRHAGSQTHRNLVEVGGEGGHCQRGSNSATRWTCRTMSRLPLGVTAELTAHAAAHQEEFNEFMDTTQRLSAREPRAERVACLARLHLRHEALGFVAARPRARLGPIELRLGLGYPGAQGLGRIVLRRRVAPRARRGRD